MLGDQAGRLVQAPGPLVRGDGRPGGKRRAGACHESVEGLRRLDLDLADLRIVGWVEDGDAFKC
jgi:hypothetical protein